MKNYVYQFVLEPQENGNFGLVFSEECETYNSPIFAVPILNGDLFSSTFKFPGEIEGSYKEFDLSNKAKGELEIYVKELEQRLIFRYYPFYDEEFYYIRRFMKGFLDQFYPLKYIGTKNNLIDRNSDFHIITPTDLILMDQLYREKKFCLVGYTPVFNGESKE
jgi:hypothetical protein